MERGEPILLVPRRTDDFSWQLPGGVWEPDDSVLVCLSHAVVVEANIRDLADLPLTAGWKIIRMRVRSTLDSGSIARNGRRRTLASGTQYP
jgi:8-oxo-dGTP pyrophosphatase MutT (NUDIX family)